MKGFVPRRPKRGMFPVRLFPGGDFSKLAAFVRGKGSSFAYERAFVTSL